MAYGLKASSCNPLIYIVPFGLAKGFSSYNSASLASAGGMGNIIGKVLSSVLLQSGITDANIHLVISLVLSGICIASALLCNDINWLLLVSAFYSVTGGSVWTAVMMVARDMGNLIHIL